MMYPIRSFLRLSRPLRPWRAARVEPQYRSDFSEVVRRERARADRTCGEFALIVFSVDASGSGSHALRAAARHLAHRTRITDPNGWLSNDRFWLLMSDCPKSYSLRTAYDVCDTFSTASETITFEASHYSAQVRRRKEAPDREEPNTTGRANGVAPANADRSSPSTSLEKAFARHTPAWKRAFDLAIAIPALVLLAPLLFLIGLLVRVTSTGPALYTQTRTGASGRPFSIYKFRTMTADAERQHANLMALNEQDGPAFKMRNDPRVTSLGRILRASCLDELPQLWNVLLGDMSLVGPRPLPVSEMERCQPWQRERLDVTPGMTCFWQIRGDRLKLAFEDWMRMDIEYARRRSFLLDLRVVLRTVTFVFGRRGT